jgi:hypothetical protein
VLLTTYFSSDKIKKNEMGRECTTHGGEERGMQCFVVETQGKETT